MSHQTSNRLGGWQYRFANWRQERPFWGGTLLVLAGFIIGYIPYSLAMNMPLVPSHFAFVGLVFAIFVVLCGIFTIAQPQLRLFFGAAGILLAIASIFGALGGFGLGTILGILGGSLVIAWEPPERIDDGPDEAISDSEAE